MYAGKRNIGAGVHTGNRNPQFGIYKTGCCGYEIVLIDGAVFPQCPEHKQPAEWELITAIESTKTKKSDPAA